jgi:hypothetical protein
VFVNELDLGVDAWQVLLQDARQYGRRPSKQVLAWLRYAARQRLDGANVELSQAQLSELLEQSLETVA